MLSQRFEVMVYIALLAMLMIVVHGGEVSMSIEAVGYPSHFYSGTKVNITCTASGVTNIQQVSLIDGTGVAGCRLDRGLNAWTSDDNLLNMRRLKAPSAEYCQRVPSSVSIVGTVTKNMENVQLSCYVLDGLDVIRSAEVTIGTVRARPMNLAMSSPDKAFRGVSVTFTCKSDGATPPSAYNYKVLKDGKLVASTNSYTPSINITGNITLKCEDNIHPNLTSDVQLAKDIPLYYLDPPQKTENTVSLNPESAMLTCDVIGYPVTYTWTCDDCTSADSSRVWTRSGSRDNGHEEKIVCTASVDSLLSVNITWTVTWDDKASTPKPTGTPPTATNPVKAEVDPVVVAVPIASIVAVAVIAVVVYCCCIKKKRSGAPAGGKSTNGDVERMKMTDKSRGTEPGSNIPGKPKHQKSKKQKKAAEIP